MVKGVKSNPLRVIFWMRSFSQIFTAHQRSCGKVMFSQESVILLRGLSHVTITHDALDFIVRSPLAQGTHPYTPHPRHGTSLYRELKFFGHHLHPQTWTWNSRKQEEQSNEMTSFTGVWSWWFSNSNQPQHELKEELTEEKSGQNSFP